MRKILSEYIIIPEGINCNYAKDTFICKKDEKIIKHCMTLQGINVSIKSDKIELSTTRGTKNDFKIIRSALAHLGNVFKGLKEPFTYVLEACYVHFPMTLKKEGDYLIIINFLGECVPRQAKILPGVDINIKGTKIELSSIDKEAAGQTAANIERATFIAKRDRRVFQDGIFITRKPGYDL